MQRSAGVERWIRFLAAGLLFAAAPAFSARGIDLTTPASPDEETPPCRLVRTETEFVLFVGDREVHRLTHRGGQNVTMDFSDRYANALLLATQTLAEMRKNKLCR